MGAAMAEGGGQAALLMHCEDRLNVAADSAARANAEGLLTPLVPDH